MTEEEAKTKWCPETRVHVVPDTGGVFTSKPLSESNPYGYVTEKSVMCIGSACMAWRWYDDLTEDGKVRIYHWKSDYGSSAYIDEDVRKRRGYCGKAGKP